MIEVHSDLDGSLQQFQSELQELIDSVGQADFSTRLFRSIRRMTNCHTVNCFAFEEKHKPQLLIAENVGSVPVSREIAHSYISDYWSLDPANGAMAADATSALKVVMIDTDDIAERTYREICYTSQNIDNRISLMGVAGDRVVRMNIYRCRENNYIDQGVKTVILFGRLLLAQLARHQELSCRHSGNEDRRFHEQLRRVEPTLTRRELEVCTQIVQGFSSEAISLNLGIALNTVLTFRKRAYFKLRISSQNELMRIVMSEAPSRYANH